MASILTRRSGSVASSAIPFLRDTAKAASATAPTPPPFVVAVRPYSSRPAPLGLPPLRPAVAPPPPRTRTPFPSSSPTASNFTAASSSAPNVQTRSFSKRKGGRMGKHLQSLDEQAHRGEREDARERRSNKKGKKDRKRGGAADEDEAAPPAAAAANLGGSDKLDLHLEADASETKFEHDFDGDGDDGEAPPPPSLPSPDDVKSRMDRVVSATSESFRSVRGSEPTPELFDSIPVRAYGTLAPLSSVAQVVIQGPTRALLSCFDPETAGAVRDAVRDSGMGFNPRIDETGGTVEVPIPKVSMETRLSLVKQLGKAAEAARQRIRRIRRAAQDVVKKGKDGKLDGVSKDDAFRVAKEIDAVTEKAIEELNDAYERKKDDVMAV